VVRYWACNMTLVHDQGTSWPGFGYTDGEKETLRSIAGKVGSPEFFVWIGLVVVFFLVFATLTAIGGVSWMSPVDVNPAIRADSSAAAFYVTLCSVMVLCLSVIFPFSLLTASWVCGRWLFSTPDCALTDRATTVHFIGKLVFQITRVAVLAGIADLALLLFVPDDSKVSLLLKWLPAVLSPAVSALTLAYYASARLRRITPNTYKQ
jgi:hypothetical protein